MKGNQGVKSAFEKRLGSYLVRIDRRDCPCCVWITAANGKVEGVSMNFAEQILGHPMKTMTYKFAPPYESPDIRFNGFDGLPMVVDEARTLNSAMVVKAYLNLQAQQFQQMAPMTFSPNDYTWATDTGSGGSGGAYWATGNSGTSVWQTSTSVAPVSPKKKMTKEKKLGKLYWNYYQRHGEKPF